jgi:hypothetical protein
MALPNIALGIKKELKNDLGRPGKALIKKTQIRKKRLTEQFRPSVRRVGPTRPRMTGSLNRPTTSTPLSKQQK